MAKTLRTLDNLVATVVEGYPELSKTTAKSILQATFAEIKKIADADEALRIHGFGTFENKKRAARSGRNPQTGETIQIPESVFLGFKQTKSKL